MLSNNLEFKKLLLLHGKDRRKQSMEIEFNNLPNSISSSGKIFQFLMAVSCQPFKSYPHIFFIRNLINIAANKFSN